MALRLVFLANILVAGWIGVYSLWFTHRAQAVVFEGAVEFSQAIRLVGALWLAIAILSGAGLFFPARMQAVLLYQLVYKFTWLLFVGLPTALREDPYPRAMAAFFLVWVVVLPFVIRWKELFG